MLRDIQNRGGRTDRKTQSVIASAAAAIAYKADTEIADGADKLIKST